MTRQWDPIKGWVDSIELATWNDIFEDNQAVNIGQPIFQPNIIGGSINIGEGDSSLRANSQGIYLGALLFASAPFSVNMAGLLKATGVDITGSITATSGRIANFYIVTNDLYGGSAAIGDAGTTIVMGNLDGTPKIALGASADSITIDGVEEGFIADGSGEFRAGNSTDFVMFRIGVDEGFSFKGTNTELTEGGLLSVSNISADGGDIGGFYLFSSTLSDNPVVASSNILLDSTNSLMRLGPTSGNYLSLDGANQRFRSSNYSSGSQGEGFNIESSFAEFGDIRARGKFTTAVFESNAISSVSGSLLTMKSSDILDADMTALDASTLQIVGDVNFSVGDFLRIKDGVDDEWFEVTNVNSAPIYTVTRDKNSDYGADANPIWKKGTAVVNYGQSGDGGILITSSEINSPRIEVFTHAGVPWTSLTTRLRVGNLNGYLGLAEDVYGFGVGDTSDFLRVYHDGSNLQFKLSLISANSLAEIEMGTDGYIRSGQTAFNTGDGWWLGNADGDDKASIGNATEFLTYVNNILQVTANFEAVTPIQLKTYAFADLPDPIVDTGANSPTASAD